MGKRPSAIVLEIQPRLGGMKVVGFAGRREPGGAGALAVVLERMGVKDRRLPWDWLGDRAFGLKPTWVVNDAEGRGLKVDGRAVKVRLGDETLLELVDRCWRRGISRRLDSGTLACVAREAKGDHTFRRLMLIAGALIAVYLVVAVVWCFVGVGGGGWLPRMPSNTALVDRLIYAGLLGIQFIPLSLAMWWGWISVRADARSVRIDAEGFEVLEGASVGARVRWNDIRHVEENFAVWTLSLHGGERLAVLGSRVLRPVLMCVRERVDPEYKARKRARLKRAMMRSAAMFVLGAVIAWVAGYWWLPPVAAPTAMGQAWFFSGMFLGVGAAYSAVGVMQLGLQIGLERWSVASGRRKRRRARRDALATGRA